MIKNQIIPNGFLERFDSAPGNKKRKFLENMKTIGVTNFLAKSFNVFPFEGEWLESFGEPEKNFTMVLYGDPGNGKTEFAVKFTKYLTNFGRVAYCSYEQGISKSLQDAFKRNKMEDESGKIIITSGGSFSDLIDLLKRNRSPQIIMIDSLDYMRLTTEQFKTLIKLFPRKAFVIICWSKNEHPKSQYAKDIEYMADIKSYVKDFVISKFKFIFLILIK